MSSIFLSYARADNAVPNDDPKSVGWVRRFYEFLDTGLRARGFLNAAVWRDVADINPSEQFAREIEEAVQRAELFIAIASRAYTQRPWCLEELEKFLRAAKVRSIADPRERVIAVFKQYLRDVERQRLPTGLQGQEGFHFYEQDPETNEYVPFAEFGRLMNEQRYLRTMTRVINAIEERLLDSPSEQEPETTVRSDGPIVFIAKPAKELENDYLRIVDELEKRGCRIRPDPDSPLPIDREAIAALLDEATREASLSVHLLGQSAGFTPDGDNQPIAAIQLDAARQAAQRSPSFQRLIWLSPALSATPRDQRPELVRSLEEGTTLLSRDELESAPFESFKQHVLRALEIGQLAKAAGVTAPVNVGPADVPLRIYVVHDEKDRAAAESVEVELFGAGSEPVLLPATADEDEHVKEIEACDALLIVWGIADAGWLNSKQRTVHRVEKERRARPFQGRAVCLCPPETHDKSRFRSNAFTTVRQGDGSLASWVRKSRDPGR
ncbi:hypothetical protein AA309_07180 [Microvirga vignae]|uniref:TIR domain-containing protein n=1 Tax=Microvirga vignae TaxID=1225564 RepID=A0A0H1RG63_9HYPH|nr:toll/interleukin-1 receptor domain-containing protein [Microvirga vignae]KLK93796.1 hypothetical protein AA309_07180 [Microvirga vignae]